MIQKKYDGFLKTPYLWKGNRVFNLCQFELFSKSQKLNIDVNEKLRLGKYVERFVSFELKQHKNIAIIAENIQIQDKKITLGELDCLLIKDDKPIHLEIIYKFYLYDDSVGTTEIEHFIGPNRKDSLIEKLTKLKNKQLPLLYNDVTKKYLTTFGLNPEDIKQQVYFKAQLFAPYTNKNIKLQLLNEACLTGFYIKSTALKDFEDCKFYIPSKKDWLVDAHQNVNWLLFDAFNTMVINYFEQQISPLCWVKFKNGELIKLFIVWW